MTEGKEEVLWTQYFKKCFDRALDDYPRSRETARGMIDDLPATFQKGGVYPGINPQVRKMRLPLKEYKIGSSGGLRLIYMALGKLFLPILIYAKKWNYKEHEVKLSTQKAQKKILSEIENSYPAEDDTPESN